MGTIKTLSGPTLHCVYLVLTLVGMFQSLPFPSIISRFRDKYLILAPTASETKFPQG
jgi:hypothetical protein